MAYKGPHTRAAPNGYNGNWELLGRVSFDELRYRQKVTVRTNSGERAAVVDLDVPNFFGGTDKALAARGNVLALSLLILQGRLTRKLVYQREDGGFDEIRSIPGEPTLQEVQKWLSEFRGDKPPNPMP